MTVVHALRTGGVTICATIHSPTAYTFGLFHSLLMLVRGRVVYFGMAGRPAVEYALSAWPNAGGRGGADANGAEWLVDLVTGADREGRGVALADAYASSQLAARHAATLDTLLAAGHPLPAHLAAELALQHETVTPLWWGLKTLLKYRTPRNYRDPEFLGPRIGEPLTMTMLMWSLYWRVGARFDGDNYINQAALLYFWVVLPAYGAASYVPAIVLERTRGGHCVRGGERNILQQFILSRLRGQLAVIHVDAVKRAGQRWRAGERGGGDAAGDDSVAPWAPGTAGGGCDRVPLGIHQVFVHRRASHSLQVCGRLHAGRVQQRHYHHQHH